MIGSNFIKRLCLRLRELRTATSANVTITFALATIPVVGFVGAAVDYSHANSVKTAMQAAVDSTALMLSKEAWSLSQSDLQNKANIYFQALFTRPEATGVTVAATYSTSNGNQIVFTASGYVKTSFMSIMGFSSLKVGAQSYVKWGNTRLRVALVLDNTGSMASDGKMSALITATNNLITQLKNASTQAGDVYVSIIPFVKDVNVNPTNYNGIWIDWTAWEAEPKIMSTWIPANTTTWEQTGPGSSCPFANNSHGFRCTQGPTSTSTTSTIPSSGTYKGYICPSTDNGNKYPLMASVAYNGCYDSQAATRTISSGSGASCGGAVNCSCSGSGSGRTCKQNYFTHTWIKNAHSTWNGCVVDRGNANGPHVNNYDANVTPPNIAIPATLYSAEQYTMCPAAAVMPLSYDWTAMTNLVNSMTPNGNTNQAIGLQLGWMSLVGGGPFPTPPAEDPNYKYAKVIILLTDGLNTQDRWYLDQTSIDNRQKLACDAVNAAGVTLYTVQVNTGGDPTSTLLKNCAGSPGKYPDPNKFFLLTSANQIIATFQQIGTVLSNLRIAQ